MGSAGPVRNGDLVLHGGHSGAGGAFTLRCCGAQVCYTGGGWNALQIPRGTCPRALPPGVDTDNPHPGRGEGHTDNCRKQEARQRPFHSRVEVRSDCWADLEG